MDCDTRNKNSLNLEQKYFVVHRLAEGFSSLQVAAALKERYGIEITDSGIRVYRRTKKWKTMIEELERKLLGNVFTIPIANKHTRLAYLQDLYFKAMAGHDEEVATKEGDVITVHKNDWFLALKAIKLAQDEIGEKESKLADALRESGSKTTVVNNIVGIGGDLPNDERERITRELAIAEGFIELPRGNIRN